MHVSGERVVVTPRQVVTGCGARILLIGAYFFFRFEAEVYI